MAIGLRPRGAYAPVGVPPSPKATARPAIPSTLVVVSLARSACQWTLVARSAKRQHRQENDPQQDNSNPESYAFAKTLRQINTKNDRDNEIDEWNEQQK